MNTIEEYDHESVEMIVLLCDAATDNLQWLTAQVPIRKVCTLLYDGQLLIVMNVSKCNLQGIIGNAYYGGMKVVTGIARTNLKSF